MYKRGRIIGATALSIIGVCAIAVGQLGGGDLKAAGIAETGFDWVQIMVWVGAGLLVVSALMFISASAE